MLVPVRWISRESHFVSKWTSLTDHRLIFVFTYCLFCTRWTARGRHHCCRREIETDRQRALTDHSNRVVCFSADFARSFFPGCTATVFASTRNWAINRPVNNVYICLWCYLSDKWKKYWSENPAFRTRSSILQTLFVIHSCFCMKEWNEACDSEMREIC